MTASLSAGRRARELAEATDGRRVDLVVVGGGVTGCGVALDAASRGLSVVLVERGDLATGTSRWSSKLVHGGLRYLAKGQVGVAYESARERHVLLTRTAPHLVRPHPFVVPFTADMTGVGSALSMTGSLLGDALRMSARTSGRLLPVARRLTPEQARELVPALGEVRGALVHWDGQLEDDARLVVALARTAAAHGARVLTYLTATAVDGGRVDICDEVTGERGSISTRQVVVATGVWTSQLVPSIRLRPSRGTHLVVRSAALQEPRASVLVLVPGSTNRWVFAVPHPDGLAYVGVTDDPVDEPPSDEPVATDEDQRYLLGILNRALRAPLSDADVVGRFAGLRPLLDTGSGATADLSRRHALRTDPDSGVHTLVGGKLTTYRAMAQDAVDRVVKLAGRGGRCRTATLPLVGAGDAAALAAVRAPTRLVRRYGTEAPAVAALGESRPELMHPVAPGLPTLGVELLFGLLHEGARTAADVLDRRTRLGLLPGEREAARPLAEALAAEVRESAPLRSSG